MPKCTYCGGTKFYEGPSGGMSVNILCANEKCRHWFNYTPAFDGLDDLKRVEPTEEQRKRQIDDRKREAEEASKARRAEGIALYYAGKPPEACLINNTYGNYGEARYNVERLCGYIKAMQEDHKMKAPQLNISLKRMAQR